MGRRVGEQIGRFNQNLRISLFLRLSFPERPFPRVPSLAQQPMLALFSRTAEMLILSLVVVPRA